MLVARPDSCRPDVRVSSLPSFVLQMRGLDCRQMRTPASACVAAAELQWPPRFPTLFMAESAAAIELSASDVAQIHVESDAMFDAMPSTCDVPFLYLRSQQWQNPVQSRENLPHRARLRPASPFLWGLRSPHFL